MTIAKETINFLGTPLERWVVKDGDAVVVTCRTREEARNYRRSQQKLEEASR